MNKYGLKDFVHVGVTGHRWHSIKFGTTPNNREFLPMIARNVLAQFEDRIELTDSDLETDGIPVHVAEFVGSTLMVHTGMATGWDLSVALACIDMEIPFVAHIPYEGFDSRWTHIDREILNYATDQAYAINWCNYGGYEAWKLMKRNKDVIHQTDFVLALYNDSDFGGTKNAIAFADGMKIPVWNVWDEYLEMYTFLVGEAERTG